MPHLDEDELLAWRGLLETQAHVLRALDEELQSVLNLSINEFDVLYQLWAADGERRMKDLAEATLVTPSGVTRLVMRLEDRGFVRRESARGRQAVVATLTRSGEQLLRRAMDVHFAGVRRLFIDELTTTDIRRLRRLWQKLDTRLVDTTTTS